MGAEMGEGGDEASSNTEEWGEAYITGSNPDRSLDVKSASIDESTVSTSKECKEVGISLLGVEVGVGTGDGRGVESDEVVPDETEME